MSAASHDHVRCLNNDADASEAEIWRGVCSAGCYRAKTDRKKCKCRCRGKHHGKGQLSKREEKGKEFF